MSKKYIRVSKGFTNYNLVPESNTLNINRDEPHYKSLYYYEEPHFEQYQKTKSIAGITGLKTDRIVFDFDSKHNVEQAQTDTKELVSRLETKGVNSENIRIYYSGSKGFHVELLTNHEFTRKEYEAILGGLAGDLPTLDTRVTDEARIFRIPLTKHQETGLYKIPLSKENLSNLSISEIETKAENVDFSQELYVSEQHKITLPEEVLKLKDAAIQPKIAEPVEINNEYHLDFTKMPKFMKPERWALAQGYFEAGERNDALHVLASYYRHIGFDSEQTFSLLVDAADKQSKRTGQEPKTEREIRDQIIRHVYSANFKGGIYTVDNSPVLKRTVERFGLNAYQTNVENKIVTIDKALENFVNYAKNIKHNTLKTGIAPLDENILMTTGMCVGILGSPSSGKTSLINNIIENMSKNGDHVIFYSLDMYETLVVGRYLQKYSGYDFKDILYKLESGENDPKLLDAINIVKENYKNVHIDSRSGLTVEEIDQGILDYEAITGHKPRLVVVDYLEKVSSQYSDSTASSGYVARQLSDIAKKRDVCLLVLLQPQKNVGDPSEPLLSMRKAKGSSVIEQDCRVMITLWRPGFYPKDQSDDNYISLAIVKNNMGSTKQFDLHWNGVTGDIREMTFSEGIEFQNAMSRIEQRKSETAKLDKWEPDF